MQAINQAAVLVAHSYAGDELDLLDALKKADMDASYAGDELDLLDALKEAAGRKEDASPMTHDGFLTLKNPKTKGQVLLHIGTQAPDARFAAGRRILTLVEGPGRGQRTSFAFVGNRRVFLWKKYKSESPWVFYAAMVEDPTRYQARVTYHFEARCRICGRPLTDPESIELGIGPTCRERFP